MPPTARASSSTSLDGLVFALAGRRVSPTAQKAWTDFARAHGGAVILASQAKWEGPRVTHVVLVDLPASKQALAAALAHQSWAIGTATPASARVRGPYRPWLQRRAPPSPRGPAAEARKNGRLKRALARGRAPELV